MSAWEPKFVRERYIRVAVIDIVTIAGIKNIYVIQIHKN
jgi:tryptophan-rich sensory protein